MLVCSKIFLGVSRLINFKSNNGFSILILSVISIKRITTDYHYGFIKQAKFIIKNTGKND